MVKKNIIVNKVSEDSRGEGLSSPALNEIKFVHQRKHILKNHCQS